MSSSPYDVVIAGAGLVGLALATALAHAGLRIALVDRARIAVPDADPAEWDSRVYAVSPGSARFLHALGAWQALPPSRINAIEAMHVVGDAGAKLDFSAYDLNERALAWIVEERALRAALLPRVLAAGVEVLSEVPFVGLSWTPDEAQMTVGSPGGTPHVLRARLIVGADGIRSWVRAAAGIVAEPRGYGQTAVVANFDCANAHHGVARQWFLDDGGILAWLPLPGRRISMVWSAPEAVAEQLRELTPAALAERVALAGGGALGALTQITPPAIFPLSLLRLPTTVAHRLALVGDAAHGIHPLAGQGMNLGLGDAEALADVLRDRGPVTDAGAPILLQRFARRRAEPVLAMQTVTDGLARLFGPPTPWLKALRNAGLAAVDRLPMVKRIMAQPALR
ncbi:MAG: FAD-dependent monooxygenase [Betaproteobacteria bacterium]